MFFFKGTLQWVKVTDPKKVQAQKESYVKDLSSNIKTLPKNIQEFIKYSVGLEFDEAPDYDKCRSMFAAELKKAGKASFSDKTNSPAVKKSKAVTDSPRTKPLKGKASVGDISNPTPAMLEIINKKKVEAEKAAKKRKKF